MEKTSNKLVDLSVAFAVEILTLTNEFVRQDFFFFNNFLRCKKWDCSLVSGCLALLALRSVMLRLFVESLFSMF